MPRTRKSLGQEPAKVDVHLGYRGPTKWNGLSNELKLVEKYDAFKRGYSKELVGNFENHPT